MDYPARRLYWTDLKTRSIESIELSGMRRKKVKQFHPKEGKPHKLEIFEGTVYFSTFQHNRIMKLNKFGRGNVTEIAEEVTRVTDLSIMHEFKQDATLFNPCVTRRCPASASLCVIVPTGDADPSVTHKCVCAEGYGGENCTKVSTDAPTSDDASAAAAANATCDGINCHNGVCKVSPGKQPKCKCDPLFKGDYCDTYICAGIDIAF
jgi:integrin beta 2